LSPADRRALAAMLADGEPQGTRQEARNGQADPEADLPGDHGAGEGTDGQNGAQAGQNEGGPER